MIRWSYLLPRVTVLAIVLLFVALALDPLLRWCLITAGQAVVGAKVEIASVTTIPRHARLNMRGIQVANPKSPLKNLFQAREANLQLDPAALIQGRLVVQDGSIAGLQFNSNRQTSGALEQREKPEDSQAFQESLQKWLDQFAALLDKQVVDQFETTAVAREVVERWPQEYARIEAELNQIRDRCQLLRDTFEQARHKPLDNLPAVQSAIVQTAELRNEILRLRRRADEIQQQFQNDYRAVDLARRRDIERIETALQLASLDSQAVTDYLLGPELAPYAVELMEWVSWGKGWLDVAGDPPRPPRQRGVDFYFPREPAAPEWLIERMAISGETRWGNERARFKGLLTGLSSDQKASGEPARFVAKLDGLHPARIELLVDHREDIPVQRFAFTCPSIALGRRAIGRDDVLLVDVDEGTASLRMNVEVRGSDIQGQLTWEQNQVRLTPRLADRYRGPRANRFLATALKDSTNLNATVKLHGTFDNPQWDLDANIGPQITDGLNQAVVRELQDRRDELVMKMQLKVIAEMTQLEQQLNDKQREIMDRLKISDELVQQLQVYAGTGNLLAPVQRTLQDKVERTIQDKVQRTLDDRIDPAVQEKLRAAQSQMPPGLPNWRTWMR